MPTGKLFVQCTQCGAMLRVARGGYYAVQYGVCFGSLGATLWLAHSMGYFSRMPSTLGAIVILAIMFPVVMIAERLAQQFAYLIPCDGASPAPAPSIAGVPALEDRNPLKWKTLSPIGRVLMGWGVIGIACSFLVLFLCRGLFVSPAYARAATAPSIVLGLAWAASAGYSMWKRDTDPNLRFERLSGTLPAWQERERNPVFAALGVLLVGVFMCGWLPVVVAIPAVHVMARGEPFEAQLTITGKEITGKGFNRCSRLYVSELADYSNGEICVPDDVYREAQPGGGVKVWGQRALTGIWIDGSRLIGSESGGVRSF